MSHAVIIKNAVKKYGDFTAVNGISLNIEQGEFFTLLGPSGCGKTTLLRMIAGFNTVDGGEICFDEQVINTLPAHKRDIGMVFQNYAIFPHLNVADNVAYGLKARKVPKEQIIPRVDEALKMVQIDQLKARQPNELSGGQQQRVALARAFVIEPGVLLMDEPCPIWTPSSGYRCAPPSRSSRAGWALPPSTSPTTRKRPWPSPTASRS